MTVLSWELSGGIEIVSPARGSRDSLIGRLSGCLFSALTAASGGHLTLLIHGNDVQATHAKPAPIGTSS